MNGLNFGWENIAQGHGGSIALTGMVIVFTALILVSLFIAVLPRVLVWVNRLYPPKPDEAVIEAASVTVATDRDEEVAALAAYLAHMNAIKTGG